MRIVVNDIAASSGGAMTILKQFYNYIKDNDCENEWIFLLSDKYLEETNNIKIECFPEVKKNRVRKVLFDCIYGKKVINTYNPDVVVSLQNIITFGVKVPQIVYIQQAIPFQKIKRFSFFKREECSCAVVQYLIGGFIKKSARKADKVFVQTKWMQDEVAKVTGVPREKISLAFPTIEVFSCIPQVFQNNRFFYPANNQIYKNIDVIVKACNILNEQGISDFIVLLTLPPGTIKHGNILCVGVLTPNQMQKEYCSRTLLFPSYIETVGLPLIEARACRTMIIAADAPYAHECLEGYNNVSYCTWNDAFSFAEEMKKVITSEKNVENKSDSYNLCLPSWEKLYEEILNVKDTLHN